MNVPSKAVSIANGRRIRRLGRVVATIGIWTARAGLLGALVASLTFVVTSSLLLLPIAWNDSLGGFPALSPLGQFLIKDIALLGVALVVTGECLTRVKVARKASRRTAGHRFPGLLASEDHKKEPSNEQ